MTEITAVDRTLTATERRNLDKLVKNDFENLRLELQQMAADVKQERLAVLRKNSKALKVAERLQGEVEKAQKNYRDALAAITKTGRTQGVCVEPSASLSHYLGYTSPTITVSEHQAEERDVARQCDDDLARAMNALERQYLKVQRDSLLASLGSEARALLDALPTAQQLMLEAANERLSRKAVA